MNRLNRLAFFSFLVGLGSFSSILFAQPPLKPGNQVLIVSSEAQLKLGYEIVAELSPGETLQITQIEGKWLGTYVSRDGAKIGGWVKRQFVQVLPPRTVQRPRDVRPMPPATPNLPRSMTPRTEIVRPEAVIPKAINPEIRVQPGAPFPEEPQEEEFMERIEEAGPESVIEPEVTDPAMIVEPEVTDEKMIIEPETEPNVPRPIQPEPIRPEPIQPEVSEPVVPQPTETMRPETRNTPEPIIPQVEPETPNPMPETPEMTNPVEPAIPETFEPSLPESVEPQAMETPETSLPTPDPPASELNIRPTTPEPNTPIVPQVEVPPTEDLDSRTPPMVEPVKEEWWANNAIRPEWAAKWNPRKVDPEFAHLKLTNPQVGFNNEAQTNQEIDAGALNLLFTDGEGQSFDLRQFYGKKHVVLVIMRGFSGFVCPYCQTQTSRLITNYQEFVDRGAEVLVVYPGPLEHVDEFVQSSQQLANTNATPFQILFDPGLQAVEELQIKADLAKPSTYILDKGGAIRFAYVGEERYDRPSLQVMLQQLDIIKQMIEP
ncbi:Hypothetical protein PBC10988_0870 [Planctomycetales bacterium 10988]|nr:Hypothetical protein PBC10988_0870 [Planctomycetales bacterium 10988]